MIALLALPIVFGAGYLIVKKYNTQAVLFGAGLLMMIVGALVGGQNSYQKGLSLLVPQRWIFS